VVRRAFLTPPETPETQDCRLIKIPSSKEWLGIFNSALLETTYAHNFEQVNSTDLTPEATAAACYAIFSAYLVEYCGECMLPGGDPLFTIGYDGQIEQLVNGEWVAPEGAYELPPTPERDEPTPEERQCLAAANCAAVLQQLYEQLADDWAAALTVAEAQTNLAAAIGLVLGAPFAAVAYPLIAIGRLVFQVVYETLEFVGADLWTSDFTDELRCLLLNCSSSDGDIVRFDYQCVIDGLARAVDILDITISELRLFGQLQYILSWIGEQGLEAAGATTGVETASCDDCGYWCFNFNLLVEDGDIVGSCATFPTATCDATWVSGVGWRGYNGGATAAGITRFLIAKTTFTECYIRRVVIVARPTGMAANNYVHTRITAHSSSDPVTHVQDGVVGSGDDVGNVLTIEDNCSELWFGCGIAPSGTVVATGYVAMFTYTIYGSGDCPFGEPNCAPE